MFHIIYMSSAVTPFSSLQLQELLAISRKNNGLLSITGLLLYKDGHFLQVIEGAAEAVEPLFEKIITDPRHNHVVEFFREEIPAREFPDWSMAFRDLSLDVQDGPEGFNDLLNGNWARRELFPPKVRAFMRIFV